MTVHASDGISEQHSIRANDSPMFLQNAILVAKNDRDNDGYDDDQDEFPDDPREYSDRDKDHVGDNQDEFPDDATEHSDHDKDRKGDNKDEDKDGDFLPDVVDPDIDGDGVANGDDLNPTDPNITIDTIAPVITAPPAISVEATGLNTTVVIGTAFAIDNIDGALPVTSDAPASYPVGTTTVTYNATDVAGNSATATQTISVVDTTAPVIIAPAALTLISTDGNPVAALIGQATATDAFAVSITNNAAATFPVGTSTVTWTATDANGNSARATQLVTVTANLADTTPPVISVPAAVTVEATGTTTAVNLGASSAIDAVDGAVIVTNNAPSVFALGATTVTYTAADAAGNTSTVTQSVTVDDTTAPVITAPAAITLTSTDGNPVFGLIGQATTTDLFAVTVSNDSSGTFPIGTSTVIWTATDANGNSASATQLVTVVTVLADTTPPVISVPATIIVEATGIATLVNLGVSSATDAVDGAVAVTANAPGAFALGTTTVTYSATDIAGNIATAIQTVTVQDTTAPVITAPTDSVASSADNQPVSVAIGQAIATDLFAVNVSNNAPVNFPVGLTTVIWTAIDANGNTSTATQLVTVALNDLVAPVITAPANITSEATAINTSLSIGLATATDIVDGVVPVSSDAPSSFPIGTTTVTYTARDVAGNVSTATQLVNVTDTTAPVIAVPANISVTSGDNKAVSATIGQASATDIFTVTLNNDAPAIFPVGVTSVTWTAIDASGNISTSIQLVTVSLQDVTPPTLIVPAAVTFEASGINTAVSIGSSSATDIVDGVVNVVSDGPASFPIGITTVTYSATDAAGNTVSATQLVTIVDTTKPVITAPANASASTGDGQPVLVTIGQANVTDLFTVSVANDAPATFPVGVTTVIWTAIDSNGNSATATQLVTVTLHDVMPPVLIAPAAVTAEASGVATVVTLGSASASDVVDGVVNVISDAPGSFPLGITTVTYSATDAAGNSSSATQLVTVIDSTAPVLTAPSDAFGTSGDNQPVAVVVGQPTASDAFAVTISNDAPATYPVGTTTVIWTATDINGNSSTAIQLVTVTLNDTTSPSITAPADVTAEATGANTLVALGSATAVDIVDGAVSVTSNAPAVFPLGTTTITYSATDAAGNASSATQLVTVVDTTAPVIFPPADSSGSSGDNQPVSVTIGQATATDAFTVKITNDASATFPVGTTTVTWTASDANGNVSSATQLVTVALNDVTPPTITSPADITVEATGPSTVVNLGASFASDIVDGAVAVSNNAPSVFSLGTTTVTYSASDASGNTATTTQIVSVVDTIAPVITAPANVSGVSGDNQAVAIAIAQANAADAFPVTITNDAPLLFPVGATTVTWTATDSNGNVSTAIQLVTVALNDTTPPSISAPANITAEATGINSSVVLGAVSATDIVDGAINVSSNAPAMFPLGTTTVVYSATDHSGNSATVTQQVTIVDRTAPVISVPANVSASSGDNQPVSVVTGLATATDIFAVNLANDAPVTYPVGVTTVTWMATDANGNVSSATQQVTVTLNDTTPPSIISPADVTVEATGINTAVTLAQASATDVVDGVLSVSSDAPTLFALGTTIVTYSATDV